MPGRIHQSPTVSTLLDHRAARLPLTLGGFRETAGFAWSCHFRRCMRYSQKAHVTLHLAPTPPHSHSSQLDHPTASTFVTQPSLLVSPDDKPIQFDPTTLYSCLIPPKLTITMRATFFALAVAGTASAVAMDDASNFMDDTAPSGYDNVVTQISDGKHQCYIRRQRGLHSNNFQRPDPSTSYHCCHQRGCRLHHGRDHRCSCHLRPR